MDGTGSPLVAADGGGAALLGCSGAQYAAILSALQGHTPDPDAAAAALCSMLAAAPLGAGRVAEWSGRIEQVAAGMNTTFLLFGGAMVFLMHGAR